jgi:hypothetical protein
LSKCHVSKVREARGSIRWLLGESIPGRGEARAKARAGRGSGTESCEEASVARGRERKREGGSEVVADELQEEMGARW